MRRAIVLVSILLASVVLSGQDYYRGGFALPASGVVTFGNPADLGLSRGGVATVYVGNGTAGDFSGTLSANTLNGFGSINTTATGLVGWGANGWMASPAPAHFILENNATTIGVRFKVDALPTVSSGFFSGGVAPAVTALSTPFFGSVNVGTVTASAVGVINFNGTAFPVAPQTTICQNTTGFTAVRCTATATQLTITSNGNFVASDVISWIVGSSK